MIVALAWIGIVAVAWAMLTLLFLAMMFIGEDGSLDRDDVLAAAMTAASIVGGLLVFTGGVLLIVGLGQVIASHT